MNEEKKRKELAALNIKYTEYIGRQKKEIEALNAQKNKILSIIHDMKTEIANRTREMSEVGVREEAKFSENRKQLLRLKNDLQNERLSFDREKACFVQLKNKLADEEKRLAVVRKDYEQRNINLDRKERFLNEKNIGLNKTARDLANKERQVKEKIAALNLEKNSIGGIKRNLEQRTKRYKNLEDVLALKLTSFTAQSNILLKRTESLAKAERDIKVKTENIIPALLEIKNKVKEIAEKEALVISRELAMNEKEKELKLKELRLGKFARVKGIEKEIAKLEKKRA